MLLQQFKSALRQPSIISLIIKKNALFFWKGLKLLEKFIWKLNVCQILDISNVTSGMSYCVLEVKIVAEVSGKTSVCHDYIIPDQTTSDLFGALNTATRLCWQPYKMNLHFNPQQEYQDCEQLQNAAFAFSVPYQVEFRTT